MNLKQILDLDIRSILNPKIWLIIVAIPHTLFGGLVPLMQSNMDSSYFTSASFGLLNTVVLLSIYFFTEGTSLSRMTAVVSGAVFVWLIAMIAMTPGDSFDFSAELAPPFLYKFNFDVELAPPLLLWGLLALSGLLHWNGPQESEEVSEEAPAIPSN